VRRVARWHPPLVLALLVAARAAAAEPLPPSPWAATLEAGAGVGSIPNHGKVGLGLGRTLGGRLSLELALRLGAGEDLLVIEPGLRAGLLFRVAERWELGFSYLVGWAQFRYAMPAGTLWVHSLVVGLRTEARWRLTRRLELRVPLMPLTLYPNEDWGVVFDPTFALAWRF
jgi:hypothetical protein